MPFPAFYHFLGLPQLPQDQVLDNIKLPVSHIQCLCIVMCITHKFPLGKCKHLTVVLETVTSTGEKDAIQY
jgi:hypothetical protein